MAVQDWTEPNVCVDENITTDDTGSLILQPWSIPRLVVDQKVLSGADGNMYAEIALPGKLLMDQQVAWRNDTPLEQTVLIRVVRASKAWVTSNPNAIQFRDRWTYTVDPDGVVPELPTTTSIYNSQTGSALDVGTDSVATPLPGRLWNWVDVNCADEWVATPLEPGDKFSLWYRQYVWTPPPFSDNANKDAPQHQAFANWTRIMLWAFPQQGTVVTG